MARSAENNSAGALAGTGSGGRSNHMETATTVTRISQFKTLNATGALFSSGLGSVAADVGMHIKEKAYSNQDVEP